MNVSCVSAASQQRHCPAPAVPGPCKLWRYLPQEARAGALAASCLVPGTAMGTALAGTAMADKALGPDMWQPVSWRTDDGLGPDCKWPDMATGQGG